MSSICEPKKKLNLIRQQFPALKNQTVFLENAGGSQVPIVVADAIRQYYLHCYAQLGAEYLESRRATSIVEKTHEWMATFTNAGSNPVIIGPSSSVLLRILGDSMAPAISNGDEIIVAESGHEANISPWLRLQDKGAVIRWLPIPENQSTCCTIELEKRLNKNTKIVAIPHVSNLLGDIVDVKKIADMAHSFGAKVVVDGVAFAPHRAIDVTNLDVDWYVFSNYKVYGPHMAVMVGKTDAFVGLEGPNFFFVDPSELSYKFELGGVNHEGCAGVLALADYFKVITGLKSVDRNLVCNAYELMEELERPLIRRILDYLSSKPSVQVLGKPDLKTKVGTISFVHRSRSSREIASMANQQDIGIRNGHMYAHRLCQSLGIEPEDGVVRISLVHYNSDIDVDKLIHFLDQVL